MKTPNKTLTEIHLVDNFGWNCYETPLGRVYFKGYLNSHPDPATAAIYVSDMLVKAEQGEVLELAALDGHFACIIQTAQATIAAVDRVCSIPLLWAALPHGGWIISDHANPFLARLSLGRSDINTASAQDIAIAGYIIGRDTLYKPVKTLSPGEVAVFRAANTTRPVISCYALYRPWLGNTDKRDEKYWRKDLKEVTLEILHKLVNRAGGRQLLLPLSAGLDSRLIASGLKHLGYRNVQCFSYGQPGNHEANAAKQIAERLGYCWHFLPTSTTEIRRCRQSKDFSRYYTLADNLFATPAEQDVFTIMNLYRHSWVDPDGIIVNGQSGDYISGKHIPDVLNGNLSSDQNQRDAIIMTEMVNKHFDLWQDLRTEKNLSRIKRNIWDQFQEFDAPIEDPNQASALYEFSEFLNRQSRFVLGNQRSYEVFGWDWHLPLWDRDYLEFWQSVPRHLKFDQRLYREMLVEQNWGGVWESLLPAPIWVTPKWIKPIRHAVRAACAPFGKEVWHRVERRMFNHIMDNICNYGAVGYWEVFFGPRHRNSVSWLTKMYLSSHGVSRDGSID